MTGRPVAGAMVLWGPMTDESSDDDPSGGFDPHLDQPEWARVVGRGAFSPHFRDASELIGKRWTGAIIWALFHGSGRFGEITRAVPGLSDRVLAERLKELIAHGVVARADGDGSGRPRYQLTEKGLDLRRIVIEIAKWAEQWKGRRGSADGEDGQPSAARDAP